MNDEQEYLERLKSEILEKLVKHGISKRAGINAEGAAAAIAVLAKGWVQAERKSLANLVALEVPEGIARMSTALLKRGWDPASLPEPTED